MDERDRPPVGGGRRPLVDERERPLVADRRACTLQLLHRAFDIMRERNPEMVAGEKKKFVLKPPQVMRVGAKKSSFSNFADICKT